MIACFYLGDSNIQRMQIFDHFMRIVLSINITSFYAEVGVGTLEYRCRMNKNREFFYSLNATLNCIFVLCIFPLKDAFYLFS
jgi:hypothetical protein